MELRSDLHQKKINLFQTNNDADVESITMQIKNLKKLCTGLKVKRKNTAVSENQANIQQSLSLYLHHFEVNYYIYFISQHYKTKLLLLYSLQLREERQVNLPTQVLWNSWEGGMIGKLI